MDYYNFYSKFSENGLVRMMPFLRVEMKNSDKTYIWNKSRDRMDLISQKFYGHPYGGPLLKMANAPYGKNEDDIPDQSVLIIPYPYRDSVQQWMESYEKYKRLYEV